MSLKGVEMQIAVPRTNEATNVQNHLNQKPTYDQAALAAQSAKEKERQKNQSTEVDASAFLNVKDEGGTKNGRQGDHKRKTKPGPADCLSPAGTNHPFKGKHIDISL